MALKVAGLPLGTLALVGVSAMESRTGASTTNETDADFPPEVAVIVVVPTASALALPAVSTVAIDVSDEDHVGVITAEVPSAYVAVAVSATVRPTGARGLTGVIASDTMLGNSTSALAEAENPE